MRIAFRLYLIEYRVQIMMQYVALLVFEVLIFQQGFSLDVHAPRVAIIGGGIGGASASHFLTQLLNGTLDIDLYEANTIGGRLATIKVDGDEVEAGGSIIHPKNMYMQRFVKLLGLEKNLVNHENMGIWNGDEFVFIESNWFPISMMKFFYRYGFQIFTLKSYINNMIEDFGKIYDLQDAGQSFANVTELLLAMNKNFPKLLQMSTKEHLLYIGFSERLIDELVQVASVVNYGQEVSNIHSFVGCVSLATNDDLWFVKGGNKKVPEHLIYRNKNVNVIPSRVTKIRNVPNIYNSSQYEVTYINKDSMDPMTSTYDIVIIAAPLTKDQKLQIEFVDFPDNLVFPGNYQTIYATFVKADLNPKYFGLEDAVDILSCNPNKTKINSIGKLNIVNGSTKSNPSIWKIFSDKSMETSLIVDMFSNVTEKAEIIWKAYPHYSTMNLENFKLHNTLYHVNVIEWAASAMEMSAIAGRNVAILAYNDFLQKSVPNEDNLNPQDNLIKKSHISDEL